MKKYLRLYFYYVFRSIKVRLVYRFDVFIGILGFLLENVLIFLMMYLIIFVILFLNGWDINMMGFLYGFYLIFKLFDYILFD